MTDAPRAIGCRGSRARESAGRNYSDVAGAIRQLLAEVSEWQKRALTAYAQGLLVARLQAHRDEEALREAQIPENGCLGSCAPTRIVPTTSRDSRRLLSGPVS
mgnify:FL=1